MYAITQSVLALLQTLTLSGMLIVASVAISANLRVLSKWKIQGVLDYGKVWCSIRVNARSMSRKRVLSTEDEATLPIEALTTYLTVNTALKVLLLSMNAFISFTVSLWFSVISVRLAMISKMVCRTQFEANAIFIISPLEYPSERCRQTCSSLIYSVSPKVPKCCCSQRAKSKNTPFAFLDSLSTKSVTTLGMGLKEDTSASLVEFRCGDLGLMMKSLCPALVSAMVRMTMGLQAMRVNTTTVAKTNSATKHTETQFVRVAESEPREEGLAMITIVLIYN